MKNILIIKAGSTFEEITQAHGEFDQMVIERMGDADHFVVDVEKGEKLPELAGISGVIMTGSHSMVSEKLTWSEETALWVRKAVDGDIPYLGLCYGHQLLAYAMGGEAGYNPNGLEIGTAQISRIDVSDPLFSSMPETFDGHVIHMQSAITLPHGSVRLAENAHDANHAFRIGEHAWGVQFHPEFSAGIIRGYVERYKDQIDYKKTVSGITETPEATSILKLFTDYCSGIKS